MSAMIVVSFFQNCKNVKLFFTLTLFNDNIEAVDQVYALEFRRVKSIRPLNINVDAAITVAEAQ